ncbi:MAG TPA: Holliday junction branch migration protein RuvA, partial [Patescibacteria group bacterium]|nr:Holliday junction branch migration protein RuvA [Patescibacteria group bacterium]
MIGSLQGIVDYKDASYLIVNVGGVGYKVLVGATISPAVGDQIKLFIHTHVREDVLELYGFTDPADLKLFEYLISVSGVGCKTALGIFSVGSRKEIINAITGNDVAF